MKIILALEYHNWIEPQPSRLQPNVVKLVTFTLSAPICYKCIETLRRRGAVEIARDSCELKSIVD